MEFSLMTTGTIGAGKHGGNGQCLPDRSAHGIRRLDIDRLGWEGCAQRAAIGTQAAAAIGVTRNAGGNRRGSPPPESEKILSRRRQKR
ncbi:hypothetical protein NKJ06_05740 [Mesorhizobium sp. M0293]|uniref:hypothetical protein n=1 Tax=unclassified Mesorhizobium TaxID=325217 RepID=UPI00333C816E